MQHNKKWPYKYTGQKDIKQINKEYSNILFHWIGGCSNITDYSFTGKITIPWRRNTHTHSAIQNKDALTKARTSYVDLKLFKPTNTLTPPTAIYYTIRLYAVSTSNSFFLHIYSTLSGATTPGHSGLWSDGNIGTLPIPQSFNITGASPSDCLLSYPGHSLRQSNPSSEMQSVDWATLFQKFPWRCP